MEINELDIKITDENIDALEDQTNPRNTVASIDCLALNPVIAEQVNSGGRHQAQYKLIIFKVNIEEQDVFLLYFEDGDVQDTEDFAARSHFYATEEEAKAAMGEEYNDWLTRF